MVLGLSLLLTNNEQVAYQFPKNSRNSLISKASHKFWTMFSISIVLQNAMIFQIIIQSLAACLFSDIAIVNVGVAQ